MRTAVVLFTRDLRVNDHPALWVAAATAERVVPLFVLDDHLLSNSSPNRVSFLLDSLADLDRSLSRSGAPLVLRRGEIVAATQRVVVETGADALFVGRDVSGYAKRREERLAAACRPAGVEFRGFPGVTVVAPGELSRGNRDLYRVFTPYWRRWCAEPLRLVLPPPVRLQGVGGIGSLTLPALSKLVSGRVSPDLAAGGEVEARARLDRWLEEGLEHYGDARNQLRDGSTSRLSPYLHFGCLSATEVVTRARARPRSEAFVRQLCWRDFYTQLLHANPDLPSRDLHPRPRGDQNERLLDAWKEGRTGYPIVDAGMRQLAREGWMHNRARLLTAAFLVKNLGLDWRLGAAHFNDLLVDGDVANNYANWQWVAGTGTDPRPGRRFNPIAQSKRLDPDGEYLRRYVPELAALEGSVVHEPWLFSDEARARLGYPEPIVEPRSPTSSRDGRQLTLMA